MTNHILRRPKVQQIVGLSRSTLYARIAAGEFPKPISLGGRIVGWLHADIERWLEQQALKSGHHYIRAEGC